MERKASLQWFNTVLEDKPGKAGAQRAPHGVSIGSTFLGREVVEYLMFHLVVSLIIQDCLQSPNPLPVSASKSAGLHMCTITTSSWTLSPLILPGVLYQYFPMGHGSFVVCVTG